MDYYFTTAPSCDSKLVWQKNHGIENDKVRLVIRYNPSPITMGQTLLKDLVMAKKWVALKTCVIRGGI